MRGLKAGVGHAGLLDGAGRQRVEKTVAVIGRLDAAVQDDHRAPVGLAADEAAETLAETQHGVGHLVVVEWIVVEVAPGLDYRVVGHREGQAAEQQRAQDARFQVNALPEAGGAQEHGAGVGLQPVDELTRRAVDALGQHGDAIGTQLAAHAEGCVAQGAVGGEQGQQVAVQFPGHVEDDLGGAVGVVGSATGVGQVVGDEQQGVAAVVERAVHQQFVAVFGEAHPLAQEVKAGVGGQRGAGQDDRFLFGEEIFGQDGANGQRRGVQGEAAAHHVEPLDLLFVVASENGGQAVVNLGDGVGGAGQFGGGSVVGEGKPAVGYGALESGQPVDALTQENRQRFPLNGGQAPGTGLACALVQGERLAFLVGAVAAVGARGAAVQPVDGLPEALPGLSDLVAAGAGVGDGVSGPGRLRGVAQASRGDV